MIWFYSRMPNSCMVYVTICNISQFLKHSLLWASWVSFDLSFRLKTMLWNYRGFHTHSELSIIIWKSNFASFSYVYFNLQKRNLNFFKKVFIIHLMLFLNITLVWVHNLPNFHSSLLVSVFWSNLLLLLFTM